MSTTDSRPDHDSNTLLGLGSSGVLVPGDWVLMRYGFEHLIFYVLSVSGKGAHLGHPEWLVSCSIFVPAEKLDRAELLGRGKPRWWWRFVPWRQLCLPFSPPRSLYWA